MKSFLHFLTDAKASVAADQAARQNLQGDGHGNWYDKDGNRVAVTKKGRLELLSKKERSQQPEGKDDSSKAEQQPEPKSGEQSAQQSVQQGEFGAFAVDLQDECQSLREQMALLKKTLEISQ